MIITLRQVNLWFVCSLLNKSPHNKFVYLIRPEEHTRYGFGGLKHADLLSIFKNRRKITEIRKMAELWKLYQDGKTDEMMETGKDLESEYPFLMPAIQAHIDRIARNGEPGRPVKSLIKIMEELETDEFGPIFSEFTKRESIYGFGDLQVKRLLDELKSSR